MPPESPDLPVSSSSLRRVGAVLKSYLGAWGVLFPSLVVSGFAHVFLFPRAQVVWEEAFLREPKLETHRILLWTREVSGGILEAVASDSIVGSAFWVLLAVCWWLEGFPLWQRRWRRGLFAGAFLVNTVVLFALTFWCAVLLIAAPVLTRAVPG